MEEGEDDDDNDDEDWDPTDLGDAEVEKEDEKKNEEEEAEPAAQAEEISKEEYDRVKNTILEDAPAPAPAEVDAARQATIAKIMLPWRPCAVGGEAPAQTPAAGGVAPVALVPAQAPAEGKAAPAGAAQDEAAPVAVGGGKESFVVGSSIHDILFDANFVLYDEDARTE